MPCERFRNALTDGAAGEPVAPALEAHLETCAACRSELEALRRLMAAADDELSALGTAEPSPALRVRIREAAAEAAPAPAFRWGFAWTAAAAAVLALAVFGVWRATVARAPAATAAAMNAERTPSIVLRPPSTPAHEAVTAVVSSTAGSGSSRLASGSSHRAAAVRPVRSASRPAGTEPEVLVPAGEVQALLRFASHLQTRTVSTDSILVADSSMPLPEPKALEAQPISIDPLGSTDASSTD